jgi:predicted nuclease of predicted toxin-antitoxin system
MWLLDVNLPTRLAARLQSYGITAETTEARGWRELTNGSLAEAAAREGFSALLTRDRRFGVAARSVLDALPTLAVVVVTLPQLREIEYLSSFEAAWSQRRIEPVPGAIIEWP